MVSINLKEIYSSFEFNWIQESFPKIKQLISRRIPSLPMNNLKKIKLKYPGSYEILENWINFTENHKSLTHLSFSLLIFEDHEYESVFNHLSKLNQLVDLKIESQVFNNKSIINYMRGLSDNCLKLVF